jgi:GH15 family glucan-1,4-alpha-glucosidase
VELQSLLLTNQTVSSKKKNEISKLYWTKHYHIKFYPKNNEATREQDSQSIFKSIPEKWQSNIQKNQFLSVE